MASQGVLLSNDKRWRRTSPSAAFTIDWSHPLTRDLEVVWLPNLSFGPQFVRSRSGTPTLVNASRAVLGQGTKFGQGTNRAVYYLVPSGSTLANGYNHPTTVAYVASAKDTTGSYFTYRPNTTNVAPYVTAGFYCYPTNIQAKFGFNGTNGADLYYPRPGWIGDHVYVASCTSGSQLIYLDGVQVGSATTAITSAPTQASPNVGFNVDLASPTFESTAISVMGAIWTRVLTPNEVAEFSADPFCFLRY